MRNPANAAFSAAARGLEYVAARPESYGVSKEKLIHLLRGLLWAGLAAGILPELSAEEIVGDAAKVSDLLFSAWAIGTGLADRVLASIADHRKRHRQGLRPEVVR